MAAQFSGKKQEFWLIIKSSFSESCFLIDKTGIWWHLAQGNILFSHLNFLSSHNIREQWVSGPLHGATNLRVSYEANSRGPAPLARLWQTKNRGKIWIWKGPQYNSFSKIGRNQNLPGSLLRHQNTSCLGQQRPVDCKPNEMKASMYTNAKVASLLHTDCTAGLSKHLSPKSVDGSKPNHTAVFELTPDLPKEAIQARPIHGCSPRMQHWPWEKRACSLMWDVVGVSKGKRYAQAIEGRGGKVMALTLTVPATQSKPWPYRTI